MIRPIRRTVSAVAAAGLLAATLTGCSLFSSGLDCGDLNTAVLDNNLDDTSTLESSSDDLKALGQWMADNGGDFGDAELGEAVATFGKALGPLLDLADEMQNIDPTDPSAADRVGDIQTEVETLSGDIESSANTISDKCSDFTSFGF